MRYWIFWNDLVQGPFEVDELMGLRAFNRQLLVCPELSREWKPAGERSELFPCFDGTKNGRRPMQTPPSPPFLEPPAVPLQGEFLIDSPGQQPLFEGPAGPAYPYQPVSDAPSVDAKRDPAPVTMPFRFGVVRPFNPSGSNDDKT